MINGKRVLAVVTARSGSKGLPNKNIKVLCGKPLLAWPIIAASESRYMDNIILSTDCEQYAEIARSYGAAVPFLRPANLASDEASSIDVIINVLDYLSAKKDEYDYVLLLDPTSPLTEAVDIDAAIEMLEKSNGNATSLIGVSLMETQHPAFSVTRSDDGLLAPLLGGSFKAMPRRQDLHPIYALDGSLYLSSVEAMYSEKNFCHNKTIGMVFDRYKSLEVDDLLDFICIEAVLNHRNHQKLVDELSEEKK
jgi:N-acylneuraminate cytidylyltransferase/CMP-N,N'-diacetyllegionaminic acid synthase